MSPNAVVKFIKPLVWVAFGLILWLGAALLTDTGGDWILSTSETARQVPCDEVDDAIQALDDLVEGDTSPGKAKYLATKFEFDPNNTGQVAQVVGALEEHSQYNC